jgi:hypothetical protein
VRDREDVAHDPLGRYSSSPPLCAKRADSDRSRFRRSRSPRLEMNGSACLPCVAIGNGATAGRGILAQA